MLFQASSESPIMVTVLAQGSEGYYKMGEKKTALYWHDTVNVYALPVLGTACTLSLLGLLDGSIVSSDFSLCIGRYGWLQSLAC